MIRPPKNTREAGWDRPAPPPFSLSPSSALPLARCSLPPTSPPPNEAVNVRVRRQDCRQGATGPRARFKSRTSSGLALTEHNWRRAICPVDGSMVICFISPVAEVGRSSPTRDTPDGSLFIQGPPSSRRTGLGLRARISSRRCPIRPGSHSLTVAGPAGGAGSREGTCCRACREPGRSGAVVPRRLPCALAVSCKVSHGTSAWRLSSTIVRGDPHSTG